MALNFEADPNRVQLRFGTEGLPVREELLLKSLIRILDYRTVQQWVYSPEAADLWLLAEGCQAPHASITGGKPFKVVTVSANADRAQGVLARPVRSDQLEEELNRVGSAIAGAKKAAASSAPAPLQPQPSPRAQAAVAKPASQVRVEPAFATSATMSAIESYQLIRWPNIHLLGNGQRIRLATIMLGRPLTMAEIMERSQLTQAYCLDFLAVLKAEGLIVTALTALPMLQTAGNPNSAGSSAAATEKLSLFARIRNRLNLKSPTPS
jgi:hypothetical protein